MKIRARDSTSSWCVRAQDLSWVRRNPDKQSVDCIDGKHGKQDFLHDAEAYSACGVAVDSKFEKILFAALKNGKHALAERISNLGEKQLMGSHWTGITMAVDFELRIILEAELKKYQFLTGDRYAEKKKMLEFYYEKIIELIFDYVRLTRFLELRGAICEAQEVSVDLEEKQDDGCLAALGNLEERTQDGDDSPFIAQELRGGMTKVDNKTFYNKDVALDAIAKRKQEEESSLRGGAGGATTTARKQQLREVLKEMTSMVNNMPDTQQGTEEDETIDKIMKDMAQLAENWKGRRPSKDLMKERLNHLTERLDKSIKASAAGGKDAVDERPKQSFYDKFPNLKLQEEEAGKATGKGKGRNGKGKDPMGSVPSFDLKRVYPKKSITTWHLLLRSLEEGQMPDGEVAICDRARRIAEIQALAQVLVGSCYHLGCKVRR